MRSPGPGGGRTGPKMGGSPPGGGVCCSGAFSSRAKHSENFSAEEQREAREGKRKDPGGSGRASRNWCISQRSAEFSVLNDKMQQNTGNFACGSVRERFGRKSIADLCGAEVPLSTVDATICGRCNHKEARRRGSCKGGLGDVDVQIHSFAISRLLWREEK
ncbi:hypothetical protein GW17_00003627 [Ensete ventricosum]|nr:hypothetical protein GW17_00003627 [Ensete ventricosum]